jgi:hypothetical protein
MYARGGLIAARKENGPSAPVEALVKGKSGKPCAGVPGGALNASTAIRTRTAIRV